MSLWRTSVIRVLVVAVAVCCLALTPLAPGAAAAPAGQEVCAGNLLQNPSFEGGSRKTEHLGTSLSSAVADGWFPWFVRGDENINREPEFKVEQVPLGGDPARVRTGGHSMKWFNTWATHTAGIYQRVAVAPGTRLQFSAHGMVYTGEADIFDSERRTWISDHGRHGNYRIRVGIEPGGAEPPGMGSPPPASVVWSEAVNTMDEWVHLSVTAVAQGPAVAVYLWGQPEWAVKHNDSFWDDACLVAVGRGAAPPPAPAPAVVEPPAAYPGPAIAATPAPAAAAAVGGGEVGGSGPGATAMPQRVAARQLVQLAVLPALAGKMWAVRQ